MEALLGLAKAIPPDSWLVMSLLAGAGVIGVHSVVAHLVGRDAPLWEDADADSDRELQDT